MVDIVKKIDKLRLKRGWTYYRLQEESGIDQQVFNKWVNKNTIPSIPALTKVCSALGISLAELFANNNLIELTPEIKELYDNWICLNKEEQNSIKMVINNYLKKHNKQ